jgi:hypothetical protein
MFLLEQRKLFLRKLRMLYNYKINVKVLCKEMLYEDVRILIKISSRRFFLEIWGFQWRYKDIFIKIFHWI